MNKPLIDLIDVSSIQTLTSDIPSNKPPTPLIDVSTDIVSSSFNPVYLYVSYLCAVFIPQLPGLNTQQNICVK